MPILWTITANGQTYRGQKYPDAMRLISIAMENKLRVIIEPEGY